MRVCVCVSVGVSACVCECVGRPRSLLHRTLDMEGAEGSINSREACPRLLDVRRTTQKHTYLVSCFLPRSESCHLEIDYSRTYVFRDASLLVLAKQHQHRIAPSHLSPAIQLSNSPPPFPPLISLDTGTHVALICVAIHIKVHTAQACWSDGKSHDEPHPMCGFSQETSRRWLAHIRINLARRCDGNFRKEPRPRPTLRSAEIKGAPKQTQDCRAKMC